MLPVAIETMTRHLTDVGNPSSLHASGRRARRVVEESRESIAQALNCRPGDVVFTSGGTESDNLALKGTYWSRREADPRRTRIISTAVEHHAVLDPVLWLAEEIGADVELLPVDARCRLDVDALREAIERDPASVALVSVMWANNEVGTLQPVDEVVALAAEHGIPVHTDAVQAVGSVPVDYSSSGVDLMTLTGHKVGGPFGVGALIVRRELEVTAMMHGGGQERDIRSGTLDPPAIAGFAAAVEAAVKAQPEHAERVAALRDRLVREVQRIVPDAIANGHPTERLPGNAHLRFPGCAGDSLLMLLDARDIECSTGSACSAGVAQPSHVLMAMGMPEEDALSSLRFSLGHTSTDADVDALLAAIGPVPSTGPGPRGSPSCGERGDAGRRRHVGRRGLRGGGRPRRRRGPRRHRHPPGPLAQPRVVPLRRPRVLHAGGRQRCPPRGRRDRHPVLRLGPQRAVPRGRGRGLHGRVRRRPDAEPLPAVQREDQVRRRAGPGDRARVRRRGHRALRPPAARTGRPRRRRAAPRRGRRQGPVLRPRRADPGPAAALAVPAGGHPQAGGTSRGRTPRAPGRRQARLARHLLRRRRRQRRVAAREARRPGPQPRRGHRRRRHR